MTLAGKASHLLDGAWELCIPVANSFSIDINGRDEPLIDSWFATLGLPEYLEQSKVFEYLDLSTDAAIIDGGHVISLAGTYQLLPNCETASASLHRKTTQEPDGSQIYFFLDPQRIPNPAPDRYVFAKTKHRLAWGEVREVIARLDAEWKPTTPNCIVKGTVQGEWIPCDWQLQPYTGSQPIAYAPWQTNPTSRFLMVYSNKMSTIRLSPLTATHYISSSYLSLSRSIPSIISLGQRELSRVRCSKRFSANLPGSLRDYSGP